MGPLVDRLAEALGRLRQLQAQLVHGGNADEAARVQQHLVERVQQVVLQIDGTPATDGRVRAAVEAAKKVRFPKSRGGKGIRTKGRRKAGKLIWTCCAEPKRSVSRKGKPIWVAACKWKKGQRTGQTLRVVGMGSSKPKSITLKGKRMKKCQAPTAAPSK